MALVGKLEDEIKDLKAAVSVFTQENKTLEEKVIQLTKKKDALEAHMEEVCEEFSEKLSGKLLFNQVNPVFDQILLSHLLTHYLLPTRALL